MKSGVFKDHLLLHFIVFIWGFTAIIGKLVHVGAVELVMYRTLLASIALVLIIFIKKLKFNIGKKQVLQILGIGAIMGLHWIFFFLSVKVSTVSVCLVAVSTMSLWTSLLTPIMGKGKFNLFELFLGILVIAGLYIIFKFEFDELDGIILGLLAAILAAFFFITNSSLSKKYDQYIIIFYELSGAFLGTSLLALGTLFFFPDFYSLDLYAGYTDLIYLAILALVCTVYPYTVSIELMKRLSVFTVNLSINMEPVYGIILAVLIFGEHEQMSWQFYLGALIIIFAVIIHPIGNRILKRKSVKMDLS